MESILKRMKNLDLMIVAYTLGYSSPNPYYLIIMYNVNN